MASLVKGDKMKALSIKQPWAELILRGRKTIELRSWNTRYRGYFLIHASKKVDMDAIGLLSIPLEKLLRGYILGYARLSNVIVYTSEEEFMKDKKRHLSIQEKVNYPLYGFVLEDVHMIKPIKYNGRLGFFDVPEIKLRDIQA